MRLIRDGEMGGGGREYGDGGRGGGGRILVYVSTTFSARDPPSVCMCVCVGMCVCGGRGVGGGGASVCVCVCWRVYGNLCAYECVSGYTSALIYTHTVYVCVGVRAGGFVSVNGVLCFSVYQFHFALHDVVRVLLSY